MKGNTAIEVIYRVYWKNWRGEWITNGKDYKTKKTAEKFGKSIQKQAENGVHTVQEFQA